MTWNGVFSPFERLRRTYEGNDTECEACGAADASDWTVRASGRHVRYERVCRSCGARDRREIELRHR